MKIPSLPTEDMITAGLRTLQSSTHPDRGLIVDIFADMLAAAPVMGASGSEINRFFDRMANTDLPENRRWLAEQGPPILKALCGEIIRRAEAKRADDHSLVALEIFASDLIGEDGWVGDEARNLLRGHDIHGPAVAEMDALLAVDE